MIFAKECFLPKLNITHIVERLDEEIAAEKNKGREEALATVRVCVKNTE